jgi:hypothetical protein
MDPDFKLSKPDVAAELARQAMEQAPLLQHNSRFDMNCLNKLVMPAKAGIQLPQTIEIKGSGLPPSRE